MEQETLQPEIVQPEEAGKRAQSKEDSKFMKFIKENWPSILALIYIISPIDVVPEALAPVVGYADDGFVLLLEIIRRWYLFNKKNK